MIRDRPVTSFLLIAFGVSYALGFPFNITISSIVESPSLTGLYLPRFVTVIGPAIQAFAHFAGCYGAIALALSVNHRRIWRARSCG